MSKFPASIAFLGLSLVTCAAEEPRSPGAEPSAAAVTLPLPGAAPYAIDLLERLEATKKTRGPGYLPRTRHRQADGWARYTNRLFLEASPYLLQHAHNPVDWRPWGDAAFEEARRRGVPVLLSVGYSTCHWCHVMEEESFEDEEIARFMNEAYVAIKVDREERPDVDSIYMSAVQAVAGRGGWPMTVWLTPDRKPFFGGTYFPARDGDRGAKTGFLTLLRRLREAYDAQPAELAASADELVLHVQRSLAPDERGAALPVADVLHNAIARLKGRFDATNGGLAGAPKFPSSLPVRLLLRYHRRTGDAEALRMAVLTLEKMAAGGMYDHVGGGFHRYATDSRWLVPHFEKMLYDNALLARAYLEAYQVTGNDGFARVAREILRYVERDMTAPGGAFYSATDADSLTLDGHREEGFFFTWTPAELAAALGEEPGGIVAAYYGVTPAGNFEGRSILNVPTPLPEVAARLDQPADRVRAVVEEAREVLYRERGRRPPPLRDEKILVSWNALMISAHAVAAQVLGSTEHAATAAKAADFVLRNMRVDGRLRRSFKDGRAWNNAYLDDYAFLTAALLDLFEATAERRWLEEAIALDRVLRAHYEDPAGGFFMTSDDNEVLLAREKPGYDGAEPSGNSVAVLNLLRLHEYTTDDTYRRRAEAALLSFGSALAQAPHALSEMLLAVDYRLDTPKEIVVVAVEGTRDASPLLEQLREVFVPNRALVVGTQAGGFGGVTSLVPWIEGKVARGGRATAYVCERQVCELPTTDPLVFRRQLEKVLPLPQAK